MTDSVLFPVGLSIVIPAYNEAQKIAADIAAAASFLIHSKLSGEIIVVDDGSQDGTSQIAQEAGKLSAIPLNVMRLDPHHGKGCAVRTGILASHGKYVLFADSGNCVPFDQVHKGIALIQNGACRIAHGSRVLSGCHIIRGQSFYRRFCSGLFRRFLIGGLRRHKHLTDTQCGFKVYDGDTARQLYALSKLDGFIFDIEIILLAAQHGFTILEFPVDWCCDPDSRLRPIHQSIPILRDWLTLKRRFPNW